MAKAKTHWRQKPGWEKVAEKIMSKKRGMKYTLHKENPTSFKKGENVGDENNAWKGDDAGVEAMHMWVKKWKGKASCCENCDREDSFYDWHNIDHKYRRVLDDYISLCRKCHYQFNKELREGGGQN